MVGTAPMVSLSSFDLDSLNKDSAWDFSNKLYGELTNSSSSWVNEWVDFSLFQ